MHNRNFLSILLLLTSPLLNVTKALHKKVSILKVYCHWCDAILGLKSHFQNGLCWLGLDFRKKTYFKRSVGFGFEKSTRKDLYLGLGQYVQCKYGNVYIMIRPKLDSFAALKPELNLR